MHIFRIVSEEKMYDKIGNCSCQQKHSDSYNEFALPCPLLFWCCPVLEGAVLGPIKVSFRQSVSRRTVTLLANSIHLIPFTVLHCIIDPYFLCW